MHTADRARHVSISIDNSGRRGEAAARGGGRVVLTAGRAATSRPIILVAFSYPWKKYVHAGPVAISVGK